LPETPDFALLQRLRDALVDERVTEAELRTLTEQADALVRMLDAQVTGSERRLEQLSAEPDSSLTTVATELHRIARLRPKLTEARSLQIQVDARARELRTAWLLRPPTR
jgi:hypothetical protein